MSSLIPLFHKLRYLQKYVILEIYGVYVPVINYRNDQVIIWLFNVFNIMIFGFWVQTCGKHFGCM